MYVAMYLLPSDDFIRAAEGNLVFLPDSWEMDSSKCVLSSAGCSFSVSVDSLFLFVCFFGVSSRRNDLFVAQGNLVFLKVSSNLKYYILKYQVRE